ncbi:protein of unknown function [Nitrosomonas aestuarii]|uniref:Integrase DNA-binding domain-containing protein n=1 Tax=Nitrosomonas aestuarii TaxID=52441 RepID=A0A1I4H947_9PROT|nr:integrase arm-type DNA-binding domain-containing protein [Nitrosomonas aestuarii]SFL37936.1 protein of unknown function [Nitrosomonas aestuarii]
MAKINLTTGRISSFKCAESKKQDFLWCNEVKGLAVRATAGSMIKRYIYQSRFSGKTIRLTIGKTDVWSIRAAKEEARRLQIIIDQGDDPREVKREKATIKKAAEIAKQQEERRERCTFGEAWHEYVNVRKSKWSESHLKDHLKMIRSGGETRNRSNKLTIPGCLTPFMDVRLQNISKELLTEWAEKESKERPTQARLALRLVRAFLNWCIEHDLYKDIVQNNPTKNKSIRELLGKPQVKNDVLQREQLSVWFNCTSSDLI